MTEARKTRLTTALGDAPFDAFLAASPANVDQATGYRSVSGQLFRQHQMAALVTDSGTTLVCPVADSGPAIDAGLHGDDLVCFGRFYFESVDPAAAPTKLVDQHDDVVQAIRTAVQRRLRPGQRIGVDVDGLHGLWPAVQAALPDGIETVDASSWATTVRAVKTSGEIELLAKAAALAEDGIERALAQAKPGVTEQELATEVSHAMVAGGGSPRFVVVTSGERSALADAAPSARQLRHGDLLRFDVGCVVDGYWSDVGRTAVIGEPSAEQTRRYDAILAGEQAQLDWVRPGVSAREMFDVAVRTVEVAGLAPYRRQHCGHGIGSDVYEPPIISPSFDTPLESGMTFCFETPYYQLGWGGMMVEDTVVITDSGYELLTHSDRSLRVVPA
nr:Xaa-Pro peptidase family protein [Phytoactinopolyspora alkaliphila]